MKKIITPSMAALVLGASLGGVPESNAKGWYAGVGAGWKQSNTKGDFGSINLGDEGPWGYAKTKSSSDSLLGLLFAGHTFEHTNFNWFVQANGSMDSTKKEKNNVQTPEILSATTSLRRVGSLGFDVGMGKEFKGFDVSLKAGLIGSRFDIGVQRTDRNSNFSSSNTVNAIGFAPGFKVEKRIGSFDIGLNYEYQMYEQVKYFSADESTDKGLLFQAKPRYHVVGLTVKKTF